MHLSASIIWRRMIDVMVGVLLYQVDALRGQVSGLRDELQSSSAVTAQLQSQLQESVRQREREVHSITVERDNLHSKVCVRTLAERFLQYCHECLCLSACT